MIAPEAVFMQCSPPRRYLRSVRPRDGIYAVLAPEAVFKLEYMFLFCTFTFLTCPLDLAIGVAGYYIQAVQWVSIC